MKMKNSDMRSLTKIA